MKLVVYVAVLMLAVAAQAFAQQAPMAMKPDSTAKMPPGTGAIVKEPVYNDIPSAGKKCWIGNAYYFKWKWDKKPKLGTAILIVQLFDKKDARVTTLAVTGASDMPSMRGAHDSGEVPFQLNKKGDYLLPVNVVMPGEWEVKLVFLKGKEAVYRGRILFKV